LINCAEMLDKTVFEGTQCVGLPDSKRQFVPDRCGETKGTSTKKYMY